MNEVIDAGLNFVRFSCIGYNPELYKKWMSKCLISNKVFVFFLLYAIEYQQPLNLMYHHYFPEHK